MRTLPALSGHAVITALERAGFEVVRPRDRIIFYGIALIPAGKQSCRYIGTICHLAHYAQYCGKRLSRAQFLELLNEWGKRSIVVPVAWKRARRPGWIIDNDPKSSSR
jgi:hypothetical protein